MERLKVIAPEGLRCPKEHSGMITDAAPVEVPDSRYYRRLIADGSLLLYRAPAKKATPKREKVEVNNDNTK